MLQLAPRLDVIQQHVVSLYQDHFVLALDANSAFNRIAMGVIKAGRSSCVLPSLRGGRQEQEQPDPSSLILDSTSTNLCALKVQCAPLLACASSRFCMVSSSER
eukprot:64424-Hanusia_phi.AAC.2